MALSGEEEAGTGSHLEVGADIFVRWHDIGAAHGLTTDTQIARFFIQQSVQYSIHTYYVSVCFCVGVGVHACVCVYACAHAHVYALFVCVYPCMHLNLHYACAHACAYVYPCVYIMYTCTVYVLMYTYMYRLQNIEQQSNSKHVHACLFCTCVSPAQLCAHLSDCVHECHIYIYMT